MRSLRGLYLGGLQLLQLVRFELRNLGLEVLEIARHEPGGNGMSGNRSNARAEGRLESTGGMGWAAPSHAPRRFKPGLVGCHDPSTCDLGLSGNPGGSHFGGIDHGDDLKEDPRQGAWVTQGLRIESTLAALSPPRAESLALGV